MMPFLYPVRGRSFSHLITCALGPRFTHFPAHLNRCVLIRHAPPFESIKQNRDRNDKAFPTNIRTWPEGIIEPRTLGDDSSIIQSVSIFITLVCSQVVPVTILGWVAPCNGFTEVIDWFVSTMPDWGLRLEISKNLIWKSNMYLDP